MQTTLFEMDVIEKDSEVKTSEWGTFKDSLKAPIHGWFTYPAGFSYKAVENSIKEAHLLVGKATIYDPFMGSGTTNLVAKSIGYNSVGVEAHPFVYKIAKSKMCWDISLNDLTIALSTIERQISLTTKPNDLNKYLSEQFPELVLKCFLHETLFDLLTIRDTIRDLNTSEDISEFLKTALICLLRDVSIAATGWPYIAPKKIKITSMSKKGWSGFQQKVYKMYADIAEVKRKAYIGTTNHLLLLGDSRYTVGQIKDESADHIFTSPPYLNNFDYADRTRLELYFMGDAKNWGEISHKVRTKLITSATTQINRNNARYQFLNSFKQECPAQYSFLAEATDRLSILRLNKGGKKSYDLLTIGYFNDMYQVLKDNYRILRPGSKAIYILGDSAPYGVHIPTDRLIGEIGLSIGFTNYQIQNLRERGGKWKNNPQRHNVMLRESVVILEK